MENDMKSSGSLIVNWDFSNGKDVSVLTVGKRKDGKVEIVNTYQGKEAEELYKKLTIQKKHRKTRFA